MNIFMDSEFNGFGGELISLALVSDDGTSWYNVLPLPERIDPWVAQHVVPILGKAPVAPETFRASLLAYLATRPGATIHADWPADFGYLLNCMMGDRFEAAFYVPFTFNLMTGTDPKPDVPHNALSDATALRLWHASVRPSRLDRLLRSIRDMRGALRDYGTDLRQIGIPAVDHKAFRNTIALETNMRATRNTPIDAAPPSIYGVQIVPHQEPGS